MTSGMLSADADAIRPKTRRRRPFIVSVCGDAGSGKTTLLERLLKRVGQEFRSGAIVVNAKAQRDAARLREFARYVADIPTAETGGRQIRDALKSPEVLDLELCFVESIGSEMSCTKVDFGQHIRVAVFSVSGGDDKAAEFPDRVRTADLLLLNKTDLLPHVAFDSAVFRADARHVNPAVAVMEVSAAQGAGLDDWERWLRAALRRYEVVGVELLVRPTEMFLG